MSNNPNFNDPRNIKRDRDGQHRLPAHPEDSGGTRERRPSDDAKEDQALERLKRRDDAPDDAADEREPESA